MLKIYLKINKISFYIHVYTYTDSNDSIVTQLRVFYYCFPFVSARFSQNPVFQL